MRLLLDTHAFLWWSLDDAALSRRAFAAIEDEGNVVFVSAVSAMEIATKHRIGKLPEAADVLQDFHGAIASQRFEPLSLTVAQGCLAGTMQGEHRDPFDRLLAGQALDQDMTLVSADPAFDQFGVTRLW